MVSDLPNNSPENSPPSEAQLIAWFSTLVTAVTVTASTPVARSDPSQAVKVMADAVGMFPAASIQAVIGQMMRDPEAVWPSTGQMIQAVVKENRRQAQHREHREDIAAAEGKPVPMTVKRLLATEAGKVALAEGWAPSFAMDVRDGKVTPEGGLSPWYLEKRRKAQREFKTLLNELKGGFSPLAPDLKGPWLQAMIEMGQTIDSENDRLKNAVEDVQLSIY